MPDLPPTESVTLECNREVVPVLFRIRVAGAASADVVFPCGVYAVTSACISRGAYGVAITLDVDGTVKHDSPAPH